MEHRAEAKNGMLDKACTRVSSYHKLDSILTQEFGIDWLSLLPRICLCKFKFGYNVLDFRSHFLFFDYYKCLKISYHEPVAALNQQAS